jgi:hypothetical protein
MEGVLWISRAITRVLMGKFRVGIKSLRATCLKIPRVSWKITKEDN